jgi:hypothetical protein
VLGKRTNYELSVTKQSKLERKKRAPASLYFELNALSCRRCHESVLNRPSGLRSLLCRVSLASLVALGLHRGGP